MLRHLNVFLHFIKYCWMGEMEFRFNFFIWIVVNIIWGVTNLVFVNIVYSQVQSIAGWNKPEALILGVVYILFVSLMWVVILPNVGKFHDLIRKGEFDFYLLKPINLRFLVSTKVVEFDQLPKIILLPFILNFFLRSAGYSPNIFQIGQFILLICLGLFIFYSFFFIIMISNFWLINTFNLENLFDSLIDIGKFPTQIFSGLLRILFVYIAPVAYIATFPTLALIGKSSISSIIIATLIAISMFIISQLFWNFALRRYSSASS